MTVIRRFVEWLSYHPTTEEIARALATEYLSEFSVLGLRFGRINNDDSITIQVSLVFQIQKMFADETFQVKNGVQLILQKFKQLLEFLKKSGPLIRKCMSPPCAIAA